MIKTLRRFSRVKPQLFTKISKKIFKKLKCYYSLRKKGVSFLDVFIAGKLPYFSFFLPFKSLPFRLKKNSFLRFAKLSTVAVLLLAMTVDFNGFLPLDKVEAENKSSVISLVPQKDQENEPAEILNVPSIEETVSTQMQIQKSIDTDREIKKQDDKDTKKGKEGDKKETFIVSTLSEKEIIEIKERAKRYKELLETDSVKRGVIRKIFVNSYDVYYINTAVNYSTFLCFFDSFTLSDVVLGSLIFDVDLYPQSNCLILFPKAPFKNTNLTVFINKKPYHFILKEVSNSKDADFRVDIEKSPDKIPDIQLLIKMLYKEQVLDPYMSFCKITRPSCKQDICKHIDAVMEVVAPSYIKGYKIRNFEKPIIPVDAYFTAETDDYYFIFSTKKTTHIKVGEQEYEIY